MSASTMDAQQIDRENRKGKRQRHGFADTPVHLLLTPDQAAGALKISRRTLWTLTNTGKIPFVMIGKGDRNKRYQVSDLVAWIEGAKERHGDDAAV